MMASYRQLLCTVGLPRSGKTTWAKGSGYPMVCPDAIRLALHGQRYYLDAEPIVWGHAHLMVRALFEAGHHKVVLDSTLNTVKRRKEWMSPDWETRFILVPASKGLCLQRANADNRLELITVIERMAAEHEPLTPEEILLVPMGDTPSEPSYEVIPALDVRT